MPILTQEQAARFDRKIQVDPDSGCHLWTAATKTNGYGCVTIDSKLYAAHRVAYERSNGPIPAGLVIDHLCHVERCVNPEHLQAVTNKQNSENVGRAARASSGYRGVHYHKPSNKYAVRVRHDRKMFCGGSFLSAEEANEVAIALRNRLFTNNLLDRYATVG